MVDTSVANRVMSEVRRLQDAGLSPSVHLVYTVQSGGLHVFEVIINCGVYAYSCTTDTLGWVSGLSAWVDSVVRRRGRP